jgi:hypothetical protein
MGDIIAENSLASCQIVGGHGRGKQPAPGAEPVSRLNLTDTWRQSAIANKSELGGISHLDRLAERILHDFLLVPFHFFLELLPCSQIGLILRSCSLLSFWAHAYMQIWPSLAATEQLCLGSRRRYHNQYFLNIFFLILIP